ncbi:hypothetical protein SEA_JUMBO_97 [Gordonia phage Jumbo]|uniref:Uncharacterized protein n=1 Tax=Gordonia phage Jumbo TaxID=1887650 RepID=A0A1B3B0S2_9CAUD|nr:hypothetical protein BIZ69_gp097 [Gordonia phage Jumbo]AOE44604.1 hypothetical protein SEA_JUMBO_97 [Gordonia phage Jumbo]
MTATTAAPAAAETAAAAAAEDVKARDAENGTVNTIPAEVTDFVKIVSDLVAANPANFANEDTDEILVIREAFAKLSDKDARRQARTFIRDAKLTADKEMNDAVVTGDAAKIVPAAQRAGAYATVIQHGFKVISAERGSVKNAADPVAAAAALVAQIQLAYAVALSDIPAGISVEDFQAKVAEIVTPDEQNAATQYRAFIENGQKGDEPNVSDLAKAAARVSLGRGPKGQGRKPKAAETAADKGAETAAAETGDAAAE